MKMVKCWLAVVMMAAVVVALTSCGGGSDDDSPTPPVVVDPATNAPPVNPATNTPPVTPPALAATEADWDIVDLNSGGYMPMHLTQYGSIIGGSMISGESVTGVVSGVSMTMTTTIGTHALSLNGTLSMGGDKVAGSWLNVDFGTTGTFDGYRRGTGAGVDLTGTWSDTDLTTMSADGWQYTQVGNTLSGICLSDAAFTATGTVSGNRVDITQTYGATAVTIYGFLSVNGNIITGQWDNPTAGRSGADRITR